MSALDTALDERSAAVEEAAATLAQFDEQIKAAQDALGSEDPDARPKAGTPEFEAVEQLLKDRAKAVAAKKDAEAEERQALALAQASGSTATVTRAQNALHQAAATGDGWRVAEILNRSEVKAAFEHYANSPKTHIGSQSLGQSMSQEDLLAFARGGSMAADVVTTDLQRRGENRGILPQTRRPLSLLALIAQASASTGNSLDYVEESGSFDTAEEQAEGELKAEAEVAYEDKQEPYATIAHWIKVRKQNLADSPYLNTALPDRLKYGTLRRVETQIISGDGSAPNLDGLKNRSGIGATGFTSGDDPADLILEGIVSVILAEGTPNGVVVHPRVWQSMLTKKAAGGDEQYYSGGPFGSTALNIWGYPIVHNNGVAEDEALVGDFQNGAELVWRSPVELLMSDSDGDDFRRNRVTFLSEVRCGLAVFRPQWFNVVDVA